MEYVENGGKEYVLKPNLEGGGHNIYGADAISRLRIMSPSERKKFILMEKIVTKPIENVLISGSQHLKAKCIYEVSQYGILGIDGDAILKSESCGFLIRVKPENVNEGGIMAGVGSICSWMLEDAQ
jgi:glutathione synthase